MDFLEANMIQLLWAAFALNAATAVWLLSKGRTAYTNGITAIIMVELISDKQFHNNGLTMFLLGVVSVLIFISWRITLLAKKKDRASV